MPTKDREIIVLEPVIQDNPRFPHGLATLLKDVPREISVHELQSGPSKNIPAGIKHSVMKIADLGLSPVWHQTSNLKYKLYQLTLIILLIRNFTPINRSSRDKIFPLNCVWILFDEIDSYEST